MLRATLAAALAFSTAVLAAEPLPPYPPYPPPPPPPRYYYRPHPPVRVVDPTPPPLSPGMRVLYAPFYAAGLVLRYGLYYLIVAPFEVFNRTVTYGVEGGVERPAPPSPPPPPPDHDT
jgi:hypothetical protein